MAKVRMPVVVAVLLVAIMGVLPGATASAASSYAPGVDYVYAATNDYRTASGVSALGFDTSLQAVAQAWAERMAADYAGGMTMDQAFRHNPMMTQQIPSGWLGAGENIAMNGGYAEPFPKLMDQWKTSPAHNANMLNSTWTDVGVGVFTDSYGITWGVQVFAHYPPVMTPSGAIGAYYAAGSNAATLGSPTGSQVAWYAGGVTGVYQVFQRGMVMSSATTGTFAVVNGPIRDLWGASGGSGGSYGWPTGDQVSVTGGVQQAFQHGVLTTVVSAGSGAIATYVATGSNATTLGSATASQVSWSAGGVTGKYQVFQRGMVMSSTTTGTFAVLNGPIRDLWGTSGGSGGSYGWPTGDQVSVTGGVQQAFQHGVLTTVVSAGSGAIATYVATGSNATTLGSATGSQVAWSASGVTGKYQVFQRGMVMSSTATGTFAVLNGPIRDLWGATGGSGGSLGWPTGDVATVTGGVQQAFQNGVVFAPTGQPAVVKPSGAIGAYYAAGSNATALGSATGSQVSWSAGGVTGAYQVFQRGMVMSSATTGTFAVLNGPIRDLWGASGGSGGSYGWPTGDQQTVTGGVQQAFQHGVLTTVVSAGSGAIATYVATGSNATTLGSATASQVSWSAGGVTGNYQVFQRGMVMSSATTGTFAVLNGPIRDLWGASGGSGGSYGWPTGDQVTVSGKVQQAFQRGVVVVP